MDDQDRYAALVEDVIVGFPPDVERGQRFIVKKVQEVRRGQEVYKSIEAHHVAMTLAGYYLDSYIDFAAAKSLPDMLELIGTDTPFTFAVEGDFPVQDIFEFGEAKKSALLQQLRELYGAELSYDNFEITLTTRKGGNYGARVRYAHNQKGISRTSHNMQRITRLFGYGKDGLTIEGLAGHTVKYIDSPYFDPANPFMDKMEWPEIEDKQRLLEAMQKHLAQNELPAVSYEVDFVQYEKIDRDFESERIREAGDTVTVFDPELGFSFDARAMEYERYPFAKKSGRATLANFREFKPADVIFQASLGSHKAIAYTNKNTVIKGKKYDDSLTVVDGMGLKVEDDQGRIMVRLGQTGPGEYGQAMYNKAGDKTIWQDAATGDGRFKGQIEASAFVGGTITIGSGNNVFKAAASGIWAGNASFAAAPFSVDMAGHMKAVGAEFSGTITAAYITGGIITGTSIVGTTITGSLIQTSTSFPRSEMSVIGNLFTAMKDESHLVTVSANASIFSGSPGVVFNDGSIYTGLALEGEFLIAGNTSIRISPGGFFGTIYLNGPVTVDKFSTFVNAETGQNLQDALNSISAMAAAALAAVTSG